MNGRFSGKIGGFRPQAEAEFDSGGSSETPSQNQKPDRNQRTGSESKNGPPDVSKPPLVVIAKLQRYNFTTSFLFSK
jgi:hypothetical protein